VAKTPEHARRPRDRSAQIAAVASELFAERGYQSVRMDDIAEVVGITSRAIYRHYENKQALLAHVVLGQQLPLVEVIEGFYADPAATSAEERLTKLVELSIDNRRLSVLWQREARHLEEADFVLVRDRMKKLAADYIPLLIRPKRSDLDADAEDLRAWTLGSLNSSAAFFDLGISRTQLLRELVDAGLRVIMSEAVGDASTEGDGIPRRSLASRREQLSAAAAGAFRRSGYAGVSIDDIGREVGLVGPALYRYFDNKADILVAALTRFSEWRALESLRALEEEPRDDRVIVGLVDRYAHLAAEFPDLVAVSLTERIFLPTEVRERLDRAQAENLAEWQRWLIEARPDLDPQGAAVLAHVAKTVIDDVVRTGRLKSTPGFAVELRSVIHATLGIVPQR
jgi:AcrR family transcriptional regulator